jgi:pimeloyl-ACP methyl ester carboxylesterase
MATSAPQTIIFSHGNGFPASTYGALMSSLEQRGFRVLAIDKLGHDPKFPVTDKWPHLLEQLAQFAQKAQGRSKTPCWFVGHSLGGVLSLMLACERPELVRGVVMLDAILFSGVRAAGWGLMKGTPLADRLSPAAISKKRRQVWATRAAARENFASKKIFAKWDSRCLDDYVNAFEQDAAGVHLAFDRDVESAIYNGLPHHLDGLIKRHPPKCPMAFIAGKQSTEMKQTGFDLAELTTHGRVAHIDGTHLFPMEKPDATAALVEGYLRSFV